MIGGLSLHAAQTTMYRRNVDKRTEEYTYYEAKQCSALPDGAVSYVPLPLQPRVIAAAAKREIEGGPLFALPCTNLYITPWLHLLLSFTLYSTLLYSLFAYPTRSYTLLFCPVLSQPIHNALCLHAAQRRRRSEERQF